MISKIYVLTFRPFGLISTSTHLYRVFFASRLWLSDFTMGIRPTLPFFDFFSLSMCPHGFLSLLPSPARLQCPILIPSDVGVTFAHRLAYVGGFVVAVPLQRVAYLRMPCIG